MSWTDRGKVLRQRRALQHLRRCLLEVGVQIQRDPRGSSIVVSELDGGTLGSIENGDPREPWLVKVED